MQRSLLLLTAALALAAAPARAQEERALDWFELERRDAELGFTPRSDDDALARLSDPALSAPELRAALTTLGISGLRNEVARLESWALNGDADTRVAALLALGQIGWADIDFLTEQAAAAEPEIAEAAILALLLTGEQRALEFVQRVRENLAHPYSTEADTLARWHAADAGRPETRAGRAYYELRYEAARRFGLIRGQSWRVIVLQDLLEDEAFLDRVVFGSAGELRSPAARDHFLEILHYTGPPPGADKSFQSLRAAVAVMPTEVAQMVESGVWRPPGEEAWRVLLAEIDRGRLEGLTHALLREAFFQVPALETYASTLLARAGLSEGLPRLELALDSNDPEERAMVAAALGGTGSARYLELLSDVRRDASPLVRAKALVAQFRLGARDAEGELRARFEPSMVFLPSTGERDPAEDQLALGELCRLVVEPDVRQLLVDLYPYLEEPMRLEVAVALTSTGRPEAREDVRSFLRADVPRGAQGARALQALAVDPSIEDLELLRDLFPVEADAEVNAALAGILIERHDAGILKVLASAMWREPENRSCLAAALILEVGGVEALRRELQHPPAAATRRDRFRAGFALGQFAGMQQVDELAQRLSNSDPILQGALLGALAARTY
jgi:hypothetical protein